MLISNCRISSVAIKGQELKDGESKSTTIARFTGTLTRELAETLCGRDGAAALFSRMSWLKKGPVSRDPDGAVEVELRHAKDPIVLPSCETDNYYVNGPKESVVFRLSLERNADVLRDFYERYPGWVGDIEIRVLQGSLFADEPEAEHTGEDSATLFRGSQEEMAAAVGVK